MRIRLEVDAIVHCAKPNESKALWSLGRGTERVCSGGSNESYLISRQGPREGLYEEGSYKKAPHYGMCNMHCARPNEWKAFWALSGGFVFGLYELYLMQAGSDQGGFI